MRKKALYHVSFLIQLFAAFILGFTVMFIILNSRKIFIAANTYFDKISEKNVSKEKTLTLMDLGYRLYSPNSQLSFSGLTEDNSSKELVTNNVTLAAKINKEHSYLCNEKDKSMTAYVDFNFVDLECKDYTENMDIGWYVYAYDAENGNSFSSIIYENDESYTANIDITECSNVENVIIAFAPKQYDLANDSIDIKKTEIALVAFPDILK